MKLICARFIRFFSEPVRRAYRRDLDETGLLILSVGLNQHPAVDPARSAQSRKPGTKSPARRVRWARPRAKKALESETSSHHWTGGSGGAGRQPKPEAAAAPCPCWFKPTRSRGCATLRCPYRPGKTSESRCPPNAGKRQRRAATAEANVLAPRRERKESQSDPASG